MWTSRMAASGSVTILTHALQGLSRGHFVARAGEYWAAKGGRLRVHQGLGPPPPGDLALLHVDMTRIPQPYLELARAFPRCLNLGTADISKRRISRNLLGPEDRHDGPVIVKTDLNYGGQPERLLRYAGSRRAGLARLWDRLVDRLPLAWTHRVRLGRYLLLPGMAAVPDWVWRHPDLVVERFFVERHGPLYALNMWFFLGDVDCLSISLSESPFVKAATTLRRLPLRFEIPEALRRRRAELGFDYGKFDYIVADGEPRLIDANRTPHHGPAGFSERGEEICRRMAGGLQRLAAERAA